MKQTPKPNRAKPPYRRRFTALGLVDACELLGLTATEKADFSAKVGEVSPATAEHFNRIVRKRYGIADAD